MFTCNNPSDDKHKEISDLLSDKSMVKYAVMQSEVGEKGTPHLQGYVVFNTRKMYSSVINYLKSCHIEARLGTHKQAKDYCMKEDTRLIFTEPIQFGDDSDIPQPGQRTDLLLVKNAIEKGTPIDEIERDNFGAFARHSKYFLEFYQKTRSKKVIEEQKVEMLKDSLRYWQVQVLKKIQEQGKRKILWVHESKGNVGKSYLARHLQVVKNAFYVRNAKKHDIAFAYNYEKIVVFDLTRSDQEFLNYSLIESFKDGRIFSGKYQSIMKIFKIPRVVIFANWEPDLSKLSKDRWQVIDLERQFLKNIE